jgi:hypothetical protein
VTLIKRRIYPGHHVGIWRQQPGWIVVDIWTLRLEFIR